MIRDVYHGHEAQRVMSMVTMIFGLAPAIAPILGGWLEIGFGWRSVFFFLVLFAGTLCFASYRRLPETHAESKRQPFSPRPLLHAYLRLLGTGRFLLLTSSVAFNFAGFFLYISSAPAIIYNLLKLDTHQFGYLFIPSVSGIVIGAFISGRLAGRLSARRTISLAYGVMIGAIAFNVGYHLLWPPAFPWTVLALMFYSTGMSLAVPNLTLLALDLFPENRGLAASLQGGQQSLFTAFAAGLLSPWLSVSALGLAAGAGVLMACGLLCWLIYRRLPKLEKAHARA
jgi:MFS transporter, DHA1 family, multidrug resistance protein